MRENLRLFEEGKKFTSPEDVATIDYRIKDKESADYDYNKISVNKSISKNKSALDEVVDKIEFSSFRTRFIFKKTREDSRMKIHDKLEITSESVSKRDIGEIEEECRIF